MTIKYVKRLLFKEWLPIIAVFLFVTLLSFTSDCIGAELYYDNYLIRPTFTILNLTIPISLFAVLMPISVYSYRFKLQKCDTYYQLAFKDKQLKNIRLFTGLFAVLIVYTISFFVGFAVFNAVYYLSPESIEATNYLNETRTVFRVGYHPLMLIVAYLIGLVAIAGIYFQTCLFVSLTNTYLSAYIFVLVEQVFFSFLILSFFRGVVGEWVSSLIDYSPSVIGVNSLIQQFCNVYVLDIGASFSVDLRALVLLLIFMIGTFFVCAFLVIYQKDPSGEYGGQPGTRKPALNYLIYASAVVEILLTRSLLNSAFFLLAIAIAAFYFGYRYLLTALFLHTPKLPYQHYIIIVFLSVLYFVMMII